MAYLTKRQRINPSQIMIDAPSAVASLAAGDVFLVHDASSNDNYPVSASVLKTFVENVRLTSPIYLYDAGTYLSSPVDGQTKVYADGSVQVGSPYVHISSSANASGSLMLLANGGTSETIHIRADQGTSATEGLASVQLLSDAGGIGIKSGLNAAGAVRITADAGTAETIIVHADQSEVDGAASAGAIQFIADAGGISLNAAADKDVYVAGGQINLVGSHNTANSIYLRANAGTSETIKIHADQGTSVTEGAASVSLLSDAGGVELRSTADLANAVNITSDGGTSGTITIFNDQGTSVTEGAASVQLLSDAGGIGIKSTADLASAILITADGGTSETIKVHSDQGTSATSIELLSDAGGILLNVDASGKSIHLDSEGSVDIDAVAGLSIDCDGAAANFTVTADGAGEDLTIAQDGSVDASVHISSAGTAADALTIKTTAGGMDISVAGAAAGEDLDISCNQEIRVTSTSDAAEAIYLRANGGTSETVKIHSDQGTGATSVYLLSDVGGITIDGDTDHGVKIGTNVSGMPITLGHGTSEVTVADNLTVSGDLTVTGTTTTVDVEVVNTANGVIFEGATDDSVETTLIAVDPTSSDKTIQLPNLSGYVALLSAATTTAIDATPAELNAVADVSAAASYAAAVTVADDHFIFRDGAATGANKIESIADLMTAVAGDGLAASSGVLAVDVVSSGSLQINSDKLEFKGIKEQLFMSASADGVTALTSAAYKLSGSFIRHQHALLTTADGCVHSGSKPQVFLNGVLQRSGSTAFTYASEGASSAHNNGAGGWSLTSGDDYIFIAHSCSSGFGQRIILSSSLDSDDVLAVRYVVG